MSNKRGFTLIEAVVAVSLIALMAVAGFNRILDTEKNSRDETRRADLAEIKTRLIEYYYENQFVFPGSLDAVADANNALPTDPLDQSNYIYSVDINGDGIRKDFRLEALLESPTEDQATYSVTVER